MRGDIVGFEQQYQDLHNRVRRSLVGKWVRSRDNDTGTIEDVFINTNGVTCTILWGQANRKLDQSFMRDFVQW